MQFYLAKRLKTSLTNINVKMRVFIYVDGLTVLIAKRTPKRTT